MAAALTSTIELKVTGTYTPDSDAATIQQRFNSGSTSFPAMSATFAYGSGAANVANKVFVDRRTVAGSADDDIDLAGVLTDVEGNTLTFTKIRAIIIEVIEPDGTKFLIVGPASATNPFNGPFNGTNPSIDVPYWLPLINPSAAGWAVTAGTGDILRITNGTATDTDYILIILGE